MAHPTMQHSARALWIATIRLGSARRLRFAAWAVALAGLMLALGLIARAHGQNGIREWAPAGPGTTVASPQGGDSQLGSGPAIRFNVSEPGAPGPVHAQPPAGRSQDGYPPHYQPAPEGIPTNQQEFATPAASAPTAPVVQLDLVLGRPHLLTLREPPLRLQVGDSRLVAYQAHGQPPREFAIQGLAPGTTTLTLWFGNPNDPALQVALTYLVHVRSESSPGSQGLQLAGQNASPGQGPDLQLADSAPPELAPERTPSTFPEATRSAPPRPIGQVESAPLPQVSSWEPGQGNNNGFAPAEAPAGPRLFDPPAVPYTPSRAVAQQQPPAAQPRTAPAEETAPPPRRVDHPRLDSLPGKGPALPPPSAEALRLYNKYVLPSPEPQYTLDLFLGRPRILELNEPPFRTQVGDPKLLDVEILQSAKPRELSLIGRDVGTTVLYLWFGDPDDPNRQTILGFLVNVLPDPGLKERLQLVYKALEDEINKAFPDAYVCLFLVGDKLVVSGEVKDAIEATKILQIIRANAPGQRGATANPLAQLPLNSAGIPVSPDGRSLASLENYILQGETNIINMLRIPGEQQVMLKVTVAEVSRSAARSMGIDFNINRANGTTVLGQQTGNLVTAASAGTTSLASGVANIPAIIDNGKITLAIQALRNVNLARSLAEPNLVTLNGQPAQFLAGGEFPVPIVTGGTIQGLQGVNFVPFGVQLSFTPFVTDKDRIRLQLNATVSVRDVGTGATLGQTAGGGGTFVPGLNTRTINTTVELREGQTLAVGGLLQTNLGGDTTRVPGLGDLPTIGNFFRVSHTSASESELVLLVTPELVHPMEPREIPPLPGSDYFEPDDIGFFLKGKLENTRSVDYRSPVMHSLDRMLLYRHCETLYMLGPVGHTDEPGHTDEH